MSAPDFSQVAEAAGHLLAFVLGWAALFFVGPIACVVLLVLQVAGEATPAGSGWLYAGTAAAWLLALGAWAAARAVDRAFRRMGSVIAEWTKPFTKARPRRVIVVDAATGATIGGSPSSAPPSGWEWGARREREFRDWSDAAARVRSVLRERAREAPRPAPPRPAPPRPEPPPRAQWQPPPPPRPEARARPHAAPPPPPPPAADPWRVLGIPRGSSQDAIRTAYRDLVKQYHPDRVAGMPREFQSIAHEKTREIREAYETLKHAPKR